MNYVVATIKSWNIKNFKKLKAGDKKNRWFLITKKTDLTLNKLNEIKPRYIFFPHWSWIIPEEIYKNFDCVVFHMTDLPHGRGGSPLQNLIVRGHCETAVSAIRAGKMLDAGPVYLKRKGLSLSGTADQVLRRASLKVFAMIKQIAASCPKPVPQKGKVVKFVRRCPEEGDISNLNDLKKVYDYIRMLDAEGYPPAFLKIGNLRFGFAKAKLKKNAVTANVKIIIDKNYE